MKIVDLDEGNSFAIVWAEAQEENETSERSSCCFCRAAVFESTFWTWHQKGSISVMTLRNTRKIHNFSALVNKFCLKMFARNFSLPAQIALTFAQIVLQRVFAQTPRLNESQK